MANSRAKRETAHFERQFQQDRERAAKAVADPEIARHLASKAYDPKAPRPETDPVIKQALERVADGIERRARATPDPTHALYLMKAMGRLRDAPDVWQSIEDRRKLRQSLSGVDDMDVHRGIKQKIADLHSQYGATADEGREFLDTIDKLVSGVYVNHEYPRYRDALIIAGRIRARINAAQGRIVP